LENKGVEGSIILNWILKAYEGGDSVVGIETRLGAERFGVRISSPKHPDRL
jgi:hypothetical protein